MAPVAPAIPAAPEVPEVPAVRVDPAVPVAQMGLGSRAVRAMDVAAMGQAVTSRAVQAVTSRAVREDTSRVAREDTVPVALAGLVDRANLAGPVNRVVPEGWADQGSQVGTNRAARVLNPDRAPLDLTPTARGRAPLDPIAAPPDPDPMPEADRRREPTLRAAAARQEALTRPVDRTPRPEVTPRAGATHLVEVADPKALSTQVTALALPSGVHVRPVGNVTERKRLYRWRFDDWSAGYPTPVNKKVRMAAATAAVAASLGLAGLAAATDAQAQPGPFPQWCPGDFWDQGWGDNWDWGGCHDNFRAGGPGWDNRGGPGWDNRGGPGWDHDRGGPGGPGWDHGGPGGPGGPGWNHR